MLRDACDSGIYITNEIHDIICLMFADDIASCAETAIRLQHHLNTVDKFCKDTGMEINLDKTEIIVFRNGGPLRHYESWNFRGNKINIASVYKYMGLLFTPKLSWSAAHDKLSSQAQRAIFSINTYKKSFGYFPTNELFILFDSIW